jgi:hypothetical protein
VAAEIRRLAHRRGQPGSTVGLGQRNRGRAHQQVARAIDARRRHAQFVVSKPHQSGFILAPHDVARDEVGAADEVGDEGIRRPLVEIGRRGLVLVTEAGGWCNDFFGGPDAMTKGNFILAATPALVPALRALLSH